MALRTRSPASMARHAVADRVGGDSRYGRRECSPAASPASSPPVLLALSAGVSLPVLPADERCAGDRGVDAVSSCCSLATVKSVCGRVSRALSRSSSGRTSRRWRSCLSSLPRNRIAFAIAGRRGGRVSSAFMQWFWYGSPLRSGYGSAEELFSFANIAPNAIRYFNWLIATAPVLLLAPFGFVRVRGDRHSRALAVFAVAGDSPSYLIYAVFDHWSYLALPAAGAGGVRDLRGHRAACDGSSDGRCRGGYRCSSGSCWASSRTVCLWRARSTRSSLPINSGASSKSPTFIGRLQCRASSDHLGRAKRLDALLHR